MPYQTTGGNVTTTLTLRDLFAAHALTGLADSHDFADSAQIVARAYTLADAMLRYRVEHRAATIPKKTDARVVEE